MNKDINRIKVVLADKKRTYKHFPDFEMTILRFLIVMC